MHNLLQAIAKLTYSTYSGCDPGTMYYFRNKLNARNVKGKVTNSYRAHKYLYYTVLDALCCVMFLDQFEIVNFDDVIPLPENFGVKPDDEKIAWINELCANFLKKTLL